jgi:hypothetical protein
LDIGPTEHVAVQSALARLQGPTTTVDRIEILENFVRYWHPPVVPEDGMTRQELGGVPLPATLARWFLWAGNRPEIMSGQNQLLAPKDIVVEGRFLIFYVENQGVYQWATTCESEDPPVFGRYETSDPWMQEGMALSNHLIRMCLFEAITSAPHSASTGWLGPEEFERLSKGFPVMLSAWHLPGPGNFYIGEGVFMHASTYPEDAKKSGYSLWIGAKAREPMEFLRPLVDKRWDHVEF